MKSTTWDELLSFAGDYHAVWMTPFVFITVRQFPCVYLSDYHICYPSKDSNDDDDDDDDDGKQPAAVRQYVHIMATSRSQAINHQRFFIATAGQIRN
jgi:hypothetical protein